MKGIDIAIVGLTALVMTATVAAATPAAATPSVSWKLFPDRPAEAQVTAGKADFMNSCAICHAAGADRPGTTSLQFKYGGRVPALLEQRTDLTVAAVKYFIRHGIAMMPSFRKTELSDAQVEAIANYLARKP